MGIVNKLSKIKKVGEVVVTSLSKTKAGLALNKFMTGNSGRKSLLEALPGLSQVLVKGEKLKPASVLRYMKDNPLPSAFAILSVVELADLATTMFDDEDLALLEAEYELLTVSDSLATIELDQSEREELVRLRGIELVAVEDKIDNLTHLDEDKLEDEFSVLRQALDLFDMETIEEKISALRTMRKAVLMDEGVILAYIALRNRHVEQGHSLGLTVTSEDDSE